ncbi:hypothetical protein PAPHI01_0711 [Pancytospora philotis]|nr:hypothetical protein PAPHI01_0711 [Pancytospora philotis]
MAISSFQKLEKIGEGTYGVVYKAEDRQTGRLVALKKIRPESENEGIPATTIREVFLLKNLKHSTIIDLMEVIHSDDKMYLVFEYIETDLKRLIDRFVVSSRRIDRRHVAKMAHQLCTAVSFCHSKNIFHRDLKPQNILVDEDYNIKLADFGLGRAATVPLRSYTQEVTTLWYRPPELLLGCKYYDASLDVWSLACIIAEIHTTVPLFMGDSEIDQLHKIFAVLGTPDNKAWRGVEQLPLYKKDFPRYPPRGCGAVVREPVLESLLDRMLQYSPVSRISAAEALAHAFFKDQAPIYK